MEEKFYRKLVEGYLNKQLNEEELELFLYLLAEDKLDEYMLAAMDQDIAAMENEAAPVIINLPKRQYPLFYKIAAAIAVIALGLLIFIQVKNDKKEQFTQNQERQIEIKPGSNQAILTLGDGKRVALNDSISGVLAENESTVISKEDNGLVVYKYTGNSNLSRNQLVYNKIETPKGGVYQVILPDQSKVWLNNESSIKFPVCFSENERRVEITGEVYFDISHNKRKPFRVISENQVIEVLGTTFNVNAYTNEDAVRTTLIKGSVNIRSANHSKILNPGDQAVLKTNDQLSVSKADVEGVIAWKDGYFKFDKVDIQTIMRQISRWYDVEVEYRGEIPKDQFIGKIKRNEDIKEVLKILEYGKVKFQFKGRKIIVG